MGRTHDFHQFIGYALTGDDADALGIAANRLESLRIDVKIQLCGEPDGTHHPQRVIAEGDVRIQRSADNAALHVANAVKGVKQLAIALLVQADGHGVNGEIAAFLVIVQSAIFHNGIAALAVIGLSPCPDKFQFPLAGLDLGRAVGAENSQVGTLAQTVSHSPSHLDAAAHCHKIHIVAGPFKENVPDISTNDIALAVQLIGDTSHQFHYWQIDVFGYYLTVNHHILLIWTAKLRFFLLRWK